MWEHTKTCHICQRLKVDNSKPAGLLKSTSVHNPGEMLGIDIIGPFPRSKKSNTVSVVVVDYYTKWV